MKVNAAIVLCVFVVACAGQGPDPMPVQTGTSETVIYKSKKVLVHWRTIEAAKRDCTEIMGKRADGCAMWRVSAGRDTRIEESGMVLPAGYDCVVITPPILNAYKHELHHCANGAWHLDHELWE